MINMALIKNPFNWIIIFLMLTIGGMGITLACQYFCNTSQGD